MTEDTFKTEAPVPFQFSEEGKRHCSDGRRAVAVKDHAKAVESFGRALSEVGELDVSQMSLEIADLHFLYGSSLLNVAMKQTNVLGGPAADAASASDQEDEGEEDGDGEQPADEAEQEDGAAGAPEADGEQEENDANAADAPDDFQMAWEALEVARMVYLRHPERQSDVASVYRMLGEIGLETESWEQAISDFTSALELHEKLLSPDDRQIAEDHYFIGLAMVYTQQDINMPRARKHYESAAVILKKHLDKLAEELDDLGAQVTVEDKQEQASQAADTGKGKGKAPAAAPATNGDLNVAEISIKVNLDEVAAGYTEKAEKLSADAAELIELINELREKAEDTRVSRPLENIAADLQGRDSVPKNSAQLAAALGFGDNSDSNANPFANPAVNPFGSVSAVTASAPTANVLVPRSKKDTAAPAAAAAATSGNNDTSGAVHMPQVKRAKLNNPDEQSSTPLSST